MSARCQIDRSGKVPQCPAAVSYYVLSLALNDADARKTFTRYVYYFVAVKTSTLFVADIIL